MKKKGRRDRDGISSSGKAESAMQRGNSGES